MRFGSFARLLQSAVVVATVAFTVPSVAQVQAAGSPSIPKDEITALAKIQIAITIAHDSIDAQLAQSRNKTAAAQQSLQEKLRSQIEEILHHSGLTEADYNRKTYVVSTDPEARKMFDATIAQLTGVPTPGQLPPGAVRVTVPVPAGAVGTHIGHVVNAFGDTPMGQGLLPTALAEARVAATHATLAARNTSDLAYMKTHAGHVISAIDPTIVAGPPGLGYGVKKAALGVVTHIELASKAEGASPNVITHANHIATASRNVIQRADALVAIAQKIQASTDAAEAAGLVSQMISLSQQLMAGVDTNGDGQITWQEGGLQQASEHLDLLLKGEKLTP